VQGEEAVGPVEVDRRQQVRAERETEAEERHVLVRRGLRAHTQTPMVANTIPSKR